MKKQQGFTALETVLILVVVAIVGFTAYYVWHSRQATEKTIATTNKSGQLNDTDTVAADADTLKLADWSVVYSVPASLHSELTVQPYNDGSATEYMFSLSSIEKDKSCQTYLKSVNDGDSPEVQVNRVSVSEPASPLVADGGSMTLLEYYNAHKAKNSNYFVASNMNAKWWKVGGYLYYPASSPVNFDAKRAPELATKCNNVPANFQEVITGGLATLKQY